MKSQASQLGVAGLSRTWDGMCTMTDSTMFRDLGMVNEGQLISLVGKLVCFDPLNVQHCMEMLPGGQRFFYDGGIDFGHLTYSFMDVQFVSAYPVPVLQQGTRGKVLHHDPPDWHSLHSLFEMCSGMGCMGMGALFSGIAPTIAVDHNSKMLELYSAHSNTKTFHGSIGDKDVLLSVWKFCPRPCLIGGGFNCQPFSNLGDRRGEADARSRSLPELLEAAWLLRSPVIVLENVEPVRHSKFVQHELEAFCTKTGFEMHQLTMHLDDMWVSRRTRWWCVLVAPFLGKFHLVPPPVFPEIKRIEQVMCEILPWKDHDEHVLQLQPHELRAFGLDDGTIGSKVINMKGVAPTALHAWGSQLSACECGCRKYPLSAERLQERGLHGLLIPHPDPSGDGMSYRHVHPSELSALNGVDPVIDFGDNLKLTLSGLGQLASPLQSGWVFSQIAAHFESLRLGGSPTAPIFNLQAYRSWLVSRCLQMWPVAGWECHDQKFNALVQFWVSHDHLALEELMDQERWSGILKPFFGIGDVLDHLIKHGGFDETPHLPMFTSEATVSTKESLKTADVSADADLGESDETTTLTQAMLAVVNDVVPVSSSGVSSVEPSHLGLAALHDASDSTSVDVHSRAHSPRDLPELACPPVSHALPALVAPGSVPRDTVGHFSEVDLQLPNVAVPFLSEYQLAQVRGEFSVTLAVPDALRDSHVLVVPMMMPYSSHCCALSANVCVSDLISAECALHPHLPPPCRITNQHGCDVPVSSRLVPGQVVMLWFEGESRLLPRMPSFSCEEIPLGSDVTAGLPTYVDSQVSASELGSGPGVVVPNPIYGAVRRSSHHPSPVECPVSGLVSPTLTWTKIPGMSEARKTQPYTPGTNPCVSAAPLMNLSTAQFLVLQPPTVLNESHWQSVLTQQFRASDRITVLDRQGKCWGDDELRFHIQSILLQRPVAEDVKPALFLDPLLASIWNIHPTDHIEWWGSPLRQVFGNGTPLVTAICHEGHWVPIWCSAGGSSMQIHLWDAAGSNLSSLEGFFSRLAMALGCPKCVVSRSDRPFTDEEHCGALTIAFLSHLLRGTPLPKSALEAHTLHVSLRHQFRMYVDSLQVSVKPWIWGCGTRDLAQELSVVLKDHGVPEEHCLTRAKTAIQALTSDAVAVALRHRTPWKQLKTLGNQNKFQFLLPSELQTLIEKNRNKPVGAKLKGSKSKRKSPVESPALDPAKLQLLEGFFRSSGKVMPQIDLSQIGPVATGVALTTCLQAEPYIRASKAVSHEPLALLVFGNVSAIQSMLPHESVTVPCHCAINSEPVLVDATLYQIGSGVVERHTAPQQLQMDTIEVATLKVMMFRDELSLDWESMARAPIRHLVEQLPILRLCTAKACTCPGFHNPDQLDIKEVLMDVWWRSFMRQGFQSCKPHEAYAYSVMVRVPLVIRDSLLAVSGSSGIYLEPRSEDGRTVDERYSVLWLPKLTHAELVHLRQTRPCIVGLARVGERKGVRTLLGDAEKLHKDVKPDVVFLPGGPRVQFLAGPFPYGCNRQSLARAFAQISWAAKPLQPHTPVPGKGSLWLIQASESPPVNVIATSHGEVVITLHKPLAHSPAIMSSKPVGSANTIALCEQQCAPACDLLQEFDPWKGWKGPVPTPARSGMVPPPAPTATESMKQLESRVQSAVMAQIPQSVLQGVPMQRDDLDDRVGALESQVQALLGKQTSMEQSMVDHSQRQTQQLTQMQSQINAQGQQLHGQLESQQQHLQALFEGQMAQIRGLLSKRGRDEGMEA